MRNHKVQLYKKFKARPPKDKFVLGGSGAYFEPESDFIGLLDPTKVRSLLLNKKTAIELTKGVSLKVMFNTGLEVRFIGFITYGDPKMEFDSEEDIAAILEYAKDPKEQIIKAITKEALSGTKKAATQGNETGRYNLSRMRYKGQEVAQCDEETSATLKKFIEKRNIERLIHFTRYENLESILMSGIVTQEALDTLNRDFYVNDSLRLDGHKNSISLSISHPNDKMFYKYRMRNAGDTTGMIENRPLDTKDWVVIVIKPEVLWNYKSAFCKYNAADSRISNKNIGDLCNIKSFEEMFLDHPAGTRLEERLECYDTTNSQAEVLVFDNIPIKHILAIGFNDEHLLTSANRKYNQGVANNISFVMAKDYFKPRWDVR